MDILMIKTNTGEVLTHMRMDQNYADVASMVSMLLLRHWPGKTAASYALADGDAVQLQVDLGKTLTVGDVLGGGDFDVCLKSDVTTETIIPPEGMVEGDLDPTDDVVCCA